jgi:hypothetical protein
VWHWKSTLVTKPACEGKHEIPTRAVAYEDYLAFRVVFLYDMCVDSSRILDCSWEWGVLE